MSITYSATGRLNTPRALVITSPRARLQGVRTRSPPADAEWTQRSAGARARIRSNVSAGSRPRSITSTSSSGPSGCPSKPIVTRRGPGAAAALASRSRTRYRPPRIGVSAIADGAPPCPAPGPGALEPSSVPRPSLLAPATQPRNPGRRPLQLLGRWQRLRTLPQPPQRLRAGQPLDRRDKLLALAVLLHLEVHARDPEHRPLERRPVRAPSVEARRDPRVPGDEVATDHVHHVVAEALAQAHHALRLAEHCALVVGHQALQPVLVVAPAIAARGRAHLADRVPPQPGGVVGEQRDLALEPRGEVGPQPRVRLELERVGRLVKRDPGAERLDRHVHRGRRRPNVLLDEEQPAGRGFGRDQREVVLAEHALAHEPEQDAELGGREPAVGHRLA